MARVINEVDRGTRVVAGVEVRVMQLVWNDGGRSFDVYRVDTGDDLTCDGSFGDFPTDDEVAALLGERTWWVCDGCGRRIDESQADMIVDHVRGCELVDGAGNPLGG